MWASLFIIAVVVACLPLVFGDEPEAEALLYPACSTNTDTTILNGILCDSSTAALAVGCLDNGKAYTCDPGTWTWVEVVASK